MGKRIMLDDERELRIQDDGEIQIIQDYDVITLKAEAAQKLARAISVEPWIPVEEVLPDDDIEVQVYNQAGDEFLIAHREDGWWWTEDSAFSLVNISHWRDMVPPVKEV